MLKIRLARGGRRKAPFFRVVLTEHTKPVQSGYKEVLGWFNPLKHTTELDIDAIKEWIGKGAQPSNRVAKLCLKHSQDEFFKKYIQESDRVRKVKNAPDEPEEETPPPAPAAEAATDDAPAADEAPAEETPAEAPAEEAPAEEATEEAAE